MQKEYRLLDEHKFNVRQYEDIRNKDHGGWFSWLGIPKKSQYPYPIIVTNPPSLSLEDLKTPNTSVDVVKDSSALVISPSIVKDIFFF